MIVMTVSLQLGLQFNVLMYREMTFVTVEKRININILFILILFTFACVTLDSNCHNCHRSDR